MKLEKGATYRAEVELPWYASKAMAKSRLQEAGFVSVVVWDVGDKTLAQGIWSGEDSDFEVPSQVVRVWKVS